MTDHLDDAHVDARALDSVPTSPPPPTEGVDGNDGDEAAADGADTTESTARRRTRGILDWVVVIGIALLVAFVVRTFVLAHFVVDGHSMDYTLHDGDRVFVNKLSYRLHDPRRGDVVVLHDVEPGLDRDLIKRVIAPPRRDHRDAQLRGPHRRRHPRRAVPRPDGGHTGQLRRRHPADAWCPTTTCS